MEKVLCSRLIILTTFIINSRCKCIYVIDSISLRGHHDNILYYYSHAIELTLFMWHMPQHISIN